jgi:DNA adenine methylase
MSFYSPLRYPGGKAKVAEYFKQVIKDNLLCDGVYVEPYAGGASIALSLLFNEYVSRVIINDIDRAIFAFWYAVLNKTNELCKLINDTAVNIKTWEQQKVIYREKDKSSLLELGFSTFFLNRTNRSGILKAGVIGGRRQEGKWKIDARFNKNDLISRIERIAAYKRRIELHNLDAVELVRSLRTTLPNKTLFYFDPPYYVKGKDLYYNYYADKDHNEIAVEISKVKKQKWILTYDSVSYIKQLYKNYHQFKYTLNYSAARSGKGEEVMIFSDDLYLRKKIQGGNE